MEAVCENCKNFDAKKQWCKLHNVPVVEEIIVQNLRGSKIGLLC